MPKKPPEVLKQVAVRMPPSLHKKAVRLAKRVDMSFGEFVRSAVYEKVDALTDFLKEDSK